MKHILYIITNKMKVVLFILIAFIVGDCVQIKGGLFKGIGDFIKSDTGKAILTGVSQGIETNQGRNTDGSFEGAPDKTKDDEKPPMSTGAIIGISVGALAVIGVVIYFVTKK